MEFSLLRAFPIIRCFRGRPGFFFFFRRPFCYSPLLFSCGAFSRTTFSSFFPFRSVIALLLFFFPPSCGLCFLVRKKSKGTLFASLLPFLEALCVWPGVSFCWSFSFSSSSVVPAVASPLLHTLRKVPRSPHIRRPPSSLISLPPPGCFRFVPVLFS